MAYALDLVDAPITCHAWDKTGKLLAICPNTPDLLIYEVNGKTTKLLYTLSEHTQVISSVDWNNNAGDKLQLVTCSHDRNAYVWELSKDNAGLPVWKKTLVLLKLNRAATYVRWSPDGKKFTVATGTSKFRVCTYDERQNWWQSYNIDNGHPTSVNVEFMNDNRHIICASTDRHFGYYALDENEGKIEKDKKGKKQVKLCLHDFSAQGWVNACTVSPSGTWVVFTSQDAYIRFIRTDQFEEEDKKNAFNISGLPFLSLQFISDTALIAGGFDCQPRLFVLKGEQWTDRGFIDVEGIREQSGGGQSSALAAKRAMFGGPKVTKVSSLHNNVILGIRKTGGNITTCSNDGKVGVWPISAIKAHFKDDQIE